jgi:2-(1,2-epoxy-1,2-dihydrophenyl)acetyl-CoA isomerase
METLNLTQEDGVATLAFNRADAMNTYNLKMAEELTSTFKQLADDPSVKAIILRGAGKLFMAGGDIRFFYDNLKTMPAGVLDVVRQINGVVRMMHEMNKPIIAAVHGAVAGAGISLMLGCDLIFAAQNTTFTLAYTNIGTSPDGGATYALPRLVGHKRALEILMLAERFSAEDAERWGLINWVTPNDTLFIDAQMLAERLSKGPTQVYARLKQLLQQSWASSIEAQLENEAQMFAASTVTQDFKEGVTAFIEKRPPKFTGE